MNKRQYEQTKNNYYNIVQFMCHFFSSRFLLLRSSSLIISTTTQEEQQQQQKKNKKEMKLIKSTHNGKLCLSVMTASLNGSPTISITLLCNLNMMPKFALRNPFDMYGQVKNSCRSSTLMFRHYG